MLHDVFEGGVIWLLCTPSAPKCRVGNIGVLRNVCSCLKKDWRISNTLHNFLYWLYKYVHELLAGESRLQPLPAWKLKDSGWNTELRNGKGAYELEENLFDICPDIALSRGGIELPAWMKEARSKR